MNTELKVVNELSVIASGQPYATVALLGSLAYATLRYFAIPEIPAVAVACTAAFALRASAIIFDIRMGPPGEFIRFGKPSEASTVETNDRSSS